MAATNNVIALSTRQIRSTVEKLAAIKSQIRQLKKDEEFLCELLKSHGDGEYLGETHVAVVTTSERQSLDAAIAKGFLTTSEIAQATKTSTVIACVAREI